MVELPENADISEHYGEIHECERDDRREQDSRASAVQRDSDHDCDRNLDEAREDRLRELPEDGCDHQAEDCEHDDECEKENREKEDARTPSDHSPCDIADRLPVASEAHNETSEVVHCADQYRTDENPDKCGQPAPENGNCRTYDRADSCNRCEVMPEDDTPFGWYVVGVIFPLLRWANRFRGELEDLASELTAVCVVRNDEADA